MIVTLTDPPTRSSSQRSTCSFVSPAAVVSSALIVSPPLEGSGERLLAGKAPQRCGWGVGGAEVCLSVPAPRVRGQLIGRASVQHGVAVPGPRRTKDQLSEGLCVG